MKRLNYDKIKTPALIVTEDGQRFILARASKIIEGNALAKANALPSGIYSFGDYHTPVWRRKRPAQVQYWMPNPLKKFVGLLVKNTEALRVPYDLEFDDLPGHIADGWHFVTI